MEYPAALEIEPPVALARWRPMFNWFLAIPHFVVLWFLTVIGEVVGLLSWFAIVFTGKLPSGFADFQCLVQRYTTRVNAYSFGLHDQYPPFSFEATVADPGDHPVRVEFAPAFEDRNRLTVGLRFLWAIPAVFVTMIVGLVAMVCWFVGAFAVLFTGAWPDGLRVWVIKGLQTSLRLNAYAWLLTDEYPPLSFD